MVEWFDTLITAICGPTESASPLVKTHEIQQPAPPSTTSLDASTTYMPSGEHTREDMLLSTWLQSASTKKICSTSCAALLFTTKIRWMQWKRNWEQAYPRSSKNGKDQKIIFKAFPL